MELHAFLKEIGLVNNSLNVIFIDSQYLIIFDDGLIKLLELFKSLSSIKIYIPLENKH